MSTRVQLPVGTSLSKSYEYGLDINLGTEAVPNWQPIRRISAFAPTYPKTVESVTSYDDQGAPNEDVTGRGVAISFTVHGNRSTLTGLFLPELEAIIAASRDKGEAAVVEVRWYHKPGTGTPSPTDAGRSFVTVEASRQNTGDAQNEVYSVSLTGKGEFEKIANPFQGWGEQAPAISSITPEGASEGALVTIVGTGMLGVTEIKFGAAAAPSFTIVGAGTIVVALPAGAAGTVNVTAKNSTGTSAQFPYARVV